MLDDAKLTPQDVVTLRCDLGQIDRRPPRPRWCEYDWGDAFAIAANGKVGQRLCASDTTADPKHPQLDYGQVWQSGGFTCRSERTGLTCFNSLRHGFTLSRASQQLF